MGLIFLAGAMAGGSMNTHPLDLHSFVHVIEECQSNPKSGCTKIASFPFQGKALLVHVTKLTTKSKVTRQLMSS